MRIQENLEKSKYEADGSIQIQGTTIPYHTTVSYTHLTLPTTERV